MWNGNTFPLQSLPSFLSHNLTAKIFQYFLHFTRKLTSPTLDFILKHIHIMFHLLNDIRDLNTSTLKAVRNNKTSWKSFVCRNLLILFGAFLVPNCSSTLESENWKKDSTTSGRKWYGMDYVVYGSVCWYFPNFPHVIFTIWGSTQV